MVIDITGGVEQATYTAPGTGEPFVEIFDLDREMATDELEDVADRWGKIVEVARDHGVGAEALKSMEATRDELWSDVLERKRDDAQLLAEHDRKTKRERAAALLTDAEIDGILDAHQGGSDGEPE